MSKLEKEWVDTYAVGVDLKVAGCPSMRKIVNGKVETIIARFTEALRRAEDLGYKNLRIVWRHIEGDPVYDLMADRLETDEEFESRKRHIEEKEAEEKFLYEKLKKKYGDA